ncbi:MAG: phosphatase PAP2 family protein [Chloroflexi bacterium]|nr:phosphatase PAP2 family protein [Chloroflexota bacterium]
MRPLSTRQLFDLAAAFGAAALILTVAVALREAPLPGDVSATRRLQDVGRLRDNAGLINGAGDWRWVPFAVAFILVATGQRLFATGRARGRRAETLWAFVLAFVLSWWSAILKLIVQSPRPSVDFGVSIDRLRDSYGFPSGHVYGDVVMYGLLAVTAPAYLHPRLVPAVRALCLAIIALAGPARVTVGAHWPSDTLGGYLWGVAALCLALAAARRISR